MLPVKANSKRGRPKRKLSGDDLSSDEMSKKKPSKRTTKAASLTKKANEGDKTKKKKKLVKSKVQISESSEEESSEGEEAKQQNVAKVINIPIQMFTPDKQFAQILNKANKEPEFLIMLRNLLSGCSRILRDKRSYLHKKWQNLRNSNCTQDEYLSRETELKRMEVEEISQIERDIMSKLSFANIKGFELKENLINDYRHCLVDPASKASKEQLEAEYTIEEETWLKYHDLQKRLLNLLMNEKDLVYSNSVDPIRNNQTLPHMRDKSGNEENEMDHRINTIQTEQNQQTTQFLFCKHFSEINYEKVFQNQSNPFKLNQADIYYMDPKALSWILETKSDEIYTNQKFQRETFKRYTDMLNQIYHTSKDMSDELLIEQLLEIAAYILNSVHYYQKFKLKCDLLHPLDVLLVIDKAKRERKHNSYTMLEETFQKELAGVAEAMRTVETPMVPE